MPPPPGGGGGPGSSLYWLIGLFASFPRMCALYDCCLQPWHHLLGLFASRQSDQFIISTAPGAQLAVPNLRRCSPFPPPCRGPRMVLSAAGAVDHDELVKIATDAFGSVPDEQPGQSVSSLVAADPYKFTGSEVRDRRPDTDQCCVAVAFKGAAWTDPDSIPLMVMQTMLGERAGGARGVLLLAMLLLHQHMRCQE